MELSTGEFEVYPSYFNIKEDEFAEISLTFFPTCYGLHIEKLFLICNNNTYEEIELIGDGILFEQDFIKIEVIFYDIFVLHISKHLYDCRFH